MITLVFSTTVFPYIFDLGFRAIFGPSFLTPKKTLFFDPLEVGTSPLFGLILDPCFRPPFLPLFYACVRTRGRCLSLERGGGVLHNFNHTCFITDKIYSPGFYISNFIFGISLLHKSVVVFHRRCFKLLKLN